MPPTSNIGARCGGPRRGVRGSTAVEFCLSIAFIFAPILLMLQITGDMSGAARGKGPARQRVWTAARNPDHPDPAYPYQPSEYAHAPINTVMALLTRPNSSVSSGDSGSPTWNWMSDSVFGHLLGQITPTKDPGGTRTLVFLNSGRQNPCTGWFYPIEPVEWIKGLFTSAIGDPKALIPRKEDILPMIVDLLVPGFGSFFDDIASSAADLAKPPESVAGFPLK